TSKPNLVMAISGFFFVVMFPKIFIAGFHMIDDVRWLIAKGVGMIKTSGEAGGPVVSRNTFLTTIGQLSGGLMLGSVLYGVTKGKYNYKVKKHVISDPLIPSEFNGTKIVQFSDAHLGSFMENFEDVQKGIDIINSLEADYVLFTGDLVNNVSSEAEPWIEVFNGIKAKKGKFSILGNHDYADYGQLPKEEKLSSRKRLAEIQKEMGFRLLLDENVQLKNGDAQIDLIGVENWGSSFKQKGDIDKALIGADNNRFQILMSHDPSHWDKMIKGNYPINLTLSGHTHGMQFGVEVPALNIKWSPVKFRYKYWDGLYQEGGQYLHVNRGFGFLGFPGRVGMWPEITVLELQNA
ncbi:MAG: metallophosphoesterase, partial [Flavobacteriales bacterium]